MNSLTCRKRSVDALSSGCLPKRGYTTIPLDGTKRHLTRHGIPHVAVVGVENVYSNTYFPRTVGYVIRNRDKARLDAAITARKDKRGPKPLTDIILAIREISRAAHRERDEAEFAYSQGRHTLAGNCKARKNRYYSLKDRGIVAAHQRGLVAYTGATAQGLAVYEYHQGGMSCFHSTLHPTRAERVPVAEHPEVLKVEAKEKIKGVSLNRVIATLEALPTPDGYERSEAPKVGRIPRSVTCYNYGELGHIARECPLDDDLNG